MATQRFQGRLTAFAGDARDNVPFVKLSIKTKEESTMHPLLSVLQDEDEGIQGAYKWANSPGYGKASFTLTNARTMEVTFDLHTFAATLVSISMSKKATPDLGTIVDYAFNFEKAPAEGDSEFWITYLKQKEDTDTLIPDSLGRLPKAKPLEYAVCLTRMQAEPELPLDAAGAEMEEPKQIEEPQLAEDPEAEI